MARAIIKSVHTHKVGWMTMTCFFTVRLYFIEHDDCHERSLDGFTGGLTVLLGCHSIPSLWIESKLLMSRTTCIPDPFDLCCPFMKSSEKSGFPLEVISRITCLVCITNFPGHLISFSHISSFGIYDLLSTKFGLYALNSTGSFAAMRSISCCRCSSSLFCGGPNCLHSFCFISKTLLFPFSLLSVLSSPWLSWWYYWLIFRSRYPTHSQKDL